MPIDTDLTTKQWARYAWVRDNGHLDHIAKSDRCARFVGGEQWTLEHKQFLESQRRPALTLNILRPTLTNLLGEQIGNRSEVGFRPRGGASAVTADVLTKLFKQISDNNRLAWLRSDVFADGVVTGRGFYDVRLDYNDNMQGEVKITRLNQKNVIPDPDAEEYDPDTWNEVFVTKWMTPDDIATLYNREDAEILRGRDTSMFPYGFDSIDAGRDRFGGRNGVAYVGSHEFSSLMRSIRVIERQHRVLHKQKHFMTDMGDTRPIPEDFDRDRIAFFVSKFGLKVVNKLVRRIRWTVTADNVRLHDEWSPYDHFTVVPYFPHFLNGRTGGMIEDLLDPQDLLNKVTSQELHVINTTANSGYKVKAGAITNMTVSELEQKGAQTGIVIEVNGDPDKDVQKIQPNQIPQGLDRVAFKAEEFVKKISGVGDSARGMDRADVAARAIQEKRQASATNLVKPLDNLVRTDSFLARMVLHCVQRFYTQERVFTITTDPVMGTTEDFAINQVNAAGEVVNDITLGEYDVVVTSVPHRETLEDSQFDQAVALKELGVSIPDDVLINASRLMDKAQIIEKMHAAQSSPEAQEAAELSMRGQAAEVAKTEAEARQKAADSELRQAKTQQVLVQAQVTANTPPKQESDGASELDEALALHAAQQEADKNNHDRDLAWATHFQKRQEHEDSMALEQARLAQQQRASEVQEAQAAAAMPKATQE